MAQRRRAEPDPGATYPLGIVTAAVRSELLAAVDARVERPGREWCRTLAEVTDEWVVSIFDQAYEHVPGARMALLAVGGYGRGELAPHSDLDLLLVHDVKTKKVAKLVEPVASALWYPIWDAGLKLGHAVRRVDEQLDLAATDLDSATALVTARPLAGDEELAAEVVEAGARSWRTHSKRHLAELRNRVRVRQESSGDVAYRLEPDLKDGHGGLRDVQSLWWAEAAGLRLIAEDLIDLDRCYDVLLRARVSLHVATGRTGDVLRLEDQDAVASTGAGTTPIT
jgi:[protein-PII] uridylyltransferase